MLEVKILDQYGLEPALYGIGLSYKKVEGAYIDYCNFCNNGERKHEIYSIANRLSQKDNGENKFLRQIQVALLINAPLYFWKQFDTYKVGTVAQSESTMHTIMKKPFTIDDFTHTNDGISETCLENIVTTLNTLRDEYKATQIEAKEKRKFIWESVISLLPESYMQKRLITLNYAVLRNIIKQRRNHKLPEWKTFIDEIYDQVYQPQFLPHISDGVTSE